MSGDKGGRPTRAEAAARRAARAATSFDNEVVPKALSRIADLLADPSTSPGVVVQLLQSAEALRGRLPESKDATPEELMPALWEARRVLGPEVERKFCERLDLIEAALTRLEAVMPGIAEARAAVERQRGDRLGLLILNHDPIADFVAATPEGTNGSA